MLPNPVWIIKTEHLNFLVWTQSTVQLQPCRLIQTLTGHLFNTNKIYFCSFCHFSFSYFLRLGEESWDDHCMQQQLYNFSSLNIEVDLWAVCDCCRHWSIFSALAEGVRLFTWQINVFIIATASSHISLHDVQIISALAGDLVWPRINAEGAQPCFSIEERWKTLRFHRWAKSVWWKLASTACNKP